MRYMKLIIRSLNPNLVEAYGMANRIDYWDCWSCETFKRRSYCYFRILVGRNSSATLMCFKKAAKIDNRLLKGMNLAVREP